MTDMTSSVASTRGLTKRFGADRTALASVDLDVMQGGITGLVGPDGAGKTTLIRILAGLLEPSEGEVIVLGDRPGRNLADLGYMPQRFGLYEDLTVIENLQLYADMRGLSRSEREERFERLLEFTDLGRFHARLAGKLSGGMKQKLGLACALIRTPKLLLLDEPSVGVDPVSRRELWQMVQQLTGQGIGVLWSTANLDEAEQCDSVYLLTEGQLVFSGPPQDLTGEVADRVRRLSGFEGRRRRVLTRLLDHEAVNDGTIRGRSIRLLLKPEADLDIAPLALGEGTRVEQVQASFEDAFIARLGGGPPGSSPVADNYRTVSGEGEYAIEAKGLTKHFGDFTAARDMSFAIPYGEIYGLLGPNGAGKSTTFKMLCGLLTPSEGTGAVAGYDLRTAGPVARRSLGYMAQRFSLYGDLSVRQNLDFFAGAYGLGKAAARNAIEKVIDIFNLGGNLEANAAELALGYKQRLSLACAIMHEPPVLFLDEPTSGVDPVARREFWTHINGIVEKGVTVLVTTHFMEEAEYCDNISLIYRSEQIARGTPDDLKKRAAALDARLSDPTMENAFVAMIEQNDLERERVSG
jgi:ABC-2 type transport system ATP-binding protein